MARGCEIWFLTLRKHTILFRGRRGRQSWELLASLRKEVTTDRKLHNEKLHGLNSSLNIIREGGYAARKATRQAT
jgi:hypothetical protein